MPAPVRPVAVLDANVLIPAGLRDMLLSAADRKVFRPLWQDKIQDEVRRTTVRLMVERKGLDVEKATAAVEHTLSQMRRAFPDARIAARRWTRLVDDMTCDEKDRHVLAAAVATDATHLVTSNTRDFPVASRPSGLLVQTPDRFLRDRLRESPEQVVEAVKDMSARLSHPAQTPAALAEHMANGQLVPKFGAELRELL